MTAEFEATLSLERFARYLEWRSGDRARALALYALNTQLSEALYIPLQVLEITLRNRIHTVLTEARHERWFEDDGFLLLEHQQSRITKAAEQLASERKAPTPGRVVAALTFSFWTAMLAARYENLWQETLHTIARRENGKGLTRKDFSRLLSRIRTLRNRVAHHEPIVHWDLPKHYENILLLTRWLSPTAAGFLRLPLGGANAIAGSRRFIPTSQLTSWRLKCRVEHQPLKVRIRLAMSVGSQSIRQACLDFPSLQKPGCPNSI